jgi:tRNA(Ile2) C34 agmatinyltransferase TiaS
MKKPQQQLPVCPKCSGKLDPIGWFVPKGWRCLACGWDSWKSTD